MENDGNLTFTTISSSTTASNKSLSAVDEAAIQLSVTIVLAIFIALSVLGNSLVCYVFYNQIVLQRVVYYPVISLAIADLLCGMLAMPAYIAKKQVHGGWWEGFTCDLFRFTYFFTEYASILSLMAISLERFIAVWKPVVHRTWLTRRKMSIFLLASWLDAALVSVLPFFWQRGTDDEPCVYDPTREWSLMVITTNVFTPFLIMLFCHVYTVTFALRYSRRRKIHLMERGTNATSSKYSWQSSTTSRNTTGQKKEREITRTLGLVVGAFVICWGPSTFYYFIRMVCPQCFKPSFKKIKPIMNATVKLLTFFNSCVNPIIYYWLNRVLRNAMYESLMGKARTRKKNAEKSLMRDNSTSNFNQKNKTNDREINANDCDDLVSKL